MKKTLFVFVYSLFSLLASAQENKSSIEIDYRNPREYEIAGITVSGMQYLENNDVVIMLSGLSVGKKVMIPGDDISQAIEKLHKQGMFGQIQISVTAINGTFVYLDIYLQEKPRLSRFSISGIRKGEANSVQEKMKISRGDIVTENMLVSSKRIIKDYFIDKGFYFTEVEVKQKPDTTKANHVILDFVVKKGAKTKIKNIIFTGNENLSEGVLKRSMKETKEKKIYRVMKASKFLANDYEKDKNSVISKFNENGYRDAFLVSDSVYRSGKRTISINLKIDQGRKYFFRNIRFVGNTKYSDEKLNSILRIQKGDVYDEKLLETNLYMSPDGRDISSLYMDDGYLFFQVTPVEINVENDSIDMEIQIYEGKQARINKVSVVGNTRTNDRVILREIRTKPGQLFSRSDIIRTQRELAQLRYFNPEKLSVNPKPNPADGTVDIEYVVEETSTDQLELSGGWGLGRLVGTLGVSFNNFSLRNILNKDSYRPLPTGDGQKLSLRGQSNGAYYQSYNMTFMEPWLGGKKPNAFSVAMYRSVMSNGVTRKEDGTYNSSGTLLTRQKMVVTGVTLGLGKRMKWPDDFFSAYFSLSFQNYTLDKYYQTAYSFATGNANNLNMGVAISRNSIDAPIYPKAGSSLSASVNFTFPYSQVNGKDYSTLTDAEKFKWLEYHKWKFEATSYFRVIGNLVLMGRGKFGFMGFYDKKTGLSPFERFYLGGDGLSGFALDGREIIGMRGYENQALTPSNSSGYIGGTVFSKYTIEMRYPLSLNPNATIYMLSFLEAGNSWLNIKKFEPFNVMRSGGIGVRIYLPMFGLLGLDYGIPFDATGNTSAFKGQFHFSINSSID